MGYALRLVPDRSLIVGFMWGHVASRDVIDGISNPGFDPSEGVTLDTLMLLHPNAQLSELTPQAGMEIAHVDRETYFGDGGGVAPTKLAVVCPNPLSLVTVRLIFGMAEQISDYDEERATFEDLDEALKWLGRVEADLPGQLQQMAREIMR
ncbi:MAG: hypothetical protein R8L07_21525 [Alphaproteobacteria bacterium]|nr:hypothetical protein [Alphaproteobacteria bacterium]